MFSSILFALLSINVNASAPVSSVKNVAPACETYAANLDGYRKTVCGGEVVSVCDGAGVCHFSASTY